MCVPEAIEKHVDQHDQFVQALEKHCCSNNTNPSSPSATTAAATPEMGQEWQEMSRELNWDVGDVKLYAYWYMNQLSQQQSSHHEATTKAKTDSDSSFVARTTASTTTTINTPTTIRNGTGDANKNIEIENIIQNDRNPKYKNSETMGTWSYQECILFDTLLACYGPDTNNMNTSTIDTDDNITAKIDKNPTPTRWNKIAAMIPEKTPNQCEARYHHFHTQNKATTKATSTEIETPAIEPSSSSKN